MRKQVGIKKVVRRSLSQEIFEQISDLIAKGTLNPGDQLPPERELCKQLGVGRTSLREALRSLLIMGLLDVQLGKGTFVAHRPGDFIKQSLERHFFMDSKTADDLIETRLVIEARVAFLAAQRADRDNLIEIGETVEQVQTGLQSDTLDISALDLHFHLAIARASGNQILYEMLSTIRSYQGEWHRRSVELPGSREIVLRDHRRIFDAIRNRQAEEAQQAMFEHISLARDRYREAYQSSAKL